MENLIIEDDENKIILKLNKNQFDPNYLITLIKRLRLEELAQKSDFNGDLLAVATQINTEWWNENGKDFLEGR